MSTSRFEITLRNTLPQRSDYPKDLLIMIPQPGLRIRIRRRQPRDITIPLLMRRMQRRRRLDIRIRHRRPCEPSSSTHILLRHQIRQVLRRLRDVGLSTAGSTSAGSLGTIRRSTSGWGERRRRARVVLRRHHGGCFLAGGIGEELLHVLVAPLRGLPVRVAEGARDRGDVELVEELLVGVGFVGGGGCGGHFGCLFVFERERERGGGEVGERKAEGWDRVLDGGGGAGWMLFDAGERLDLERIAHIGLIR